MLKFGRHVEQTMQFKCIIDGGLGAKPPSLGNFRIFWKKITTYLTSFDSYFERF